MKRWRGDSGQTGSDEGGFTMVELLVVLAIFGLAATAVMVSIPDLGGGLPAEAERFAARAKAARDSALDESRPAAIRVDQSGYAIDRRMGGEWRVAARYEWNSETQPDLPEGGTRVIFDPTGLSEPLHLTLRRDDDRMDVEIGHDGSIAVRR